MYMRVYICVYMRVYTRVYVRIYVCIYVCAHARIYVYIYVCMRVYVCTPRGAGGRGLSVSPHLRSELLIKIYFNLLFI